MSAISDFLERVRALVFWKREERELEEELRFHLDMEAGQNQRLGMNAADAKRRGALSLGGIEQVKEDVRDARGTRLLTDCAADFAFSLRTLSHSPGFAAVAILTLAIGIGGTTAIFSAVDAVLLQPLPYQEPGQLVRLYQSDSARRADRSFVTPVHFLDYRDRLTSFSAVAAIVTYSESGADIGTGDAVQRIRLLPVSADYFSAIRVRPELGREFRREEETGANVVILSHEVWEQRFGGNPSAIGKTLTMNGAPFTVAGVMPAGFADPIAGAIDAWVPVNLIPGRDLSNADNHYFSVIARLRPGVEITRAQAELDIVSAALTKQYGRNANSSRSYARLDPLKDDIVGSSSRALSIMLGAVGLMLVLVCVNIANLLLVRGSERAREFAVRSALGADRTRVIRQLLIESLTLALLGDVAGLFVAWFAMRAIVTLGAGSIPRLETMHLNPALLASSLVLASASALAFGLAPALRAGRTQPSDVLREQSRSVTGGRAQLRLRDWLAVVQVALAFVLLVGAGLLIASFQRLQQVDLGVKTSAVLTFELSLPDARYDSTARREFYETVARRLAALSGVEAAGGVSRLPATGAYHSWGTSATSGPLAHTAEAQSGADQRIISGDYFRVVGIPLVDGRLFDARDDAAAPGRVVISKSLAKRLFPGVSALGQTLRAGGRTSEVIGVVGDVAMNGQGDPIHFAYHTHRQWAGDRNWPLTQVIRASGPIDPLRAEARRAIASLDPQLVMHKTMMLSDVIGKGAAQRLFTLRILASFAAVALALAALGLFGVLSYGVKLRTREFGIRMALGAERGAVRGLVLREGLTIAAVGLAIGVLGAVALSRVMAAAVFRTSPLDPVVLGAVAVFVMVITGIAAYLPAHQATSVDPRTALQ